MPLETTPAKNLTDVLGVFTDALSCATTFMLDGHNRLTKLTRGDGGSDTYKLDFAGQVTSSKDAFNRETTHKYIYGSSHDYNASLGDRTKETNPDGTVWQFQYDATYHKPSAEIDPFGNRTTSTYNASGDISSRLDPFNNRTTFTYNSSSKLLETVADPYNNVTTLLYDASKRLETRIDPFGFRTTMGYDSVGNETV